MKLITWNLNGSDKARAELFKRLGNEEGDVVVAVQELWKFRDTALDKTVLEHEISKILPCPYRLVELNAKGCALLVSQGISFSNPGSSKRIVSATLSNLAGWKGLRVVGLHARSRLHASHPDQRLWHSHHVLEELQSHWGDQPAVIMGDFNAQPFDQEMLSPILWGAMRDRVALSRAKAVHIARDLLFNPCWSLLSCGVARPAGTYFYDSDGYGEGWWVFDQILVSRHLASQIGPPRLLPEWSGHDRLLEWRPGAGAVLSDHIPVYAKLAIQKVAECSTLPTKI